MTFFEKTIRIALVVYSVIQLLSLFANNPLLLFIYEVCYVIATLIAVYIFVTGRQKLIDVIKPFFYANAVLVLCYVPLVLLNPNINWALYGGDQSDPMIIYFIWPILHMIVAIVAILCLGGLAKTIMTYFNN